MPETAVSVVGMVAWPMRKPIAVGILLIAEDFHDCVHRHTAQIYELFLQRPFRRKARHAEARPHPCHEIRRVRPEALLLAAREIAISDVTVRRSHRAELGGERGVVTLGDVIVILELGEVLVVAVSVRALKVTETARWGVAMVSYLPRRQRHDLYSFDPRIATTGDRELAAGNCQSFGRGEE